jgi:diketogulonate reductase-like aldo/keto reductase
MEKLVEEGKTRMIGVSNFSVTQLKEAMECCSDHVIAANQIEYNFERRDQETDIIPFCHSHKVSVIAYTPIMRGNIHNKALRKMAEKYSATPVQVALKYVMKKSIPIPKSINRAHIDELLGARDLNLSDADYRALAES